eukprot:GHVT01028217.1.p1 GENE.GHVT01028217.1~~GHVT01028217.1.p1  ORF type:complete len:595 (-),score=163.02 GHVT01028217.1:729-2513(-)
MGNPSSSSSSCSSSCSSIPSSIPSSCSSSSFDPPSSVDFLRRASSSSSSSCSFSCASSSASVLPRFCFSGISGYRVVSPTRLLLCCLLFLLASSSSCPRFPSPLAFHFTQVSCGSIPRALQSSFEAQLHECYTWEVSAPSPSSPLPSFGPPGVETVRADQVIDGLSAPTGLAFLPPPPFMATPPDLTMLITEQDGRVMLLTCELDGSNKVAEILPTGLLLRPDTKEGAILGLAVTDNFKWNEQGQEAQEDTPTNLVFIFYVSEEQVNQGGNVIDTLNRVSKIAKFKLVYVRDVFVLELLNSDLLRGLVGSLTAGSAYKGGGLALGEDKLLYVGVGDSGVGGAAQDPASFAGKLLRITTEGTIVEGASSAVHSIGYRNPMAFAPIPKVYIPSFTPTAPVWTADHLSRLDWEPAGENGYDAIRVLTAATNAGWDQAKGCEYKPEEITHHVKASLMWNEPLGPSSAVFYEGELVSSFIGSILLVSLNHPVIQAFGFDPSNPANPIRHEAYTIGRTDRIRVIAMNKYDEHLYVTTSNCDRVGVCPTDKDVLLRITPIDFHYTSTTTATPNAAAGRAPPLTFTSIVALISLTAALAIAF